MVLEWSEGFDRGHKMGYQAGWEAAIQYVRSQTFDMDCPYLVDREYHKTYDRPVEEVLAQLAEEAEV